MFQRNVRMEDGIVYTVHEAVGISHNKASGTTIEVMSYDSELAAEGFRSKHVRELAVGMTFEQAEAWLQTLPACDDIRGTLDEVLGILTDEQAETVIDAFPAWAAGIAYEVGKRVRYGGVLYRCVQAHTSQADWTPDIAASLWSRIGDPGDEWPEWVQPTGAHDAYAQGTKVSHDGKHWTSDIDANIYEPGVYGWTQTE